MQGVRIELDIVVGEGRLPAEIYQAGTGNSFGIMVNRWFEGYIVKYSEGWIYWPSSKESIIYAEDVLIILDILKERFPDLYVFETSYQFCPRVELNSKYDHCYLIPRQQERERMQKNANMR